MILALFGGAAGVLFGLWGNRIFTTLVPAEFPDLMRKVYVDYRVLAFALIVSVATGLLFGLLPALRASKVQLNDLLKEGARGAASSRGRGRNALLVAKVALSMVLLVGAGLMMRGFMKERSELPGFDTRNLLTADILLGGDEYGVALGILGGIGLSQLLNTVFWRLTAFDPVAFGGVTGLMVGAAVLAAWLPAARVTRIDPQRALRYD